MRPTAGNAALRPAQNLSRSVSSREVRISVAPAIIHDFLDARDLVGDFLRGAVGFAQQDRRRVQRITGAHELFDGRGGLLVHHLQSRPE